MNNQQKKLLKLCQSVLAGVLNKTKAVQDALNNLERLEYGYNEPNEIDKTPSKNKIKNNADNHGD